MIKDSVYKRYIPEIDAPEGIDGGEAVWFIFSGNKMLVKVGQGKLLPPRFVRPAEVGLEVTGYQYLGTLDKVPAYSGEVNDEKTVPEGMEFRELRSLYGAMEDDEFLLAGKAIQIAAWDTSNQFCSRCGTAVEVVPGERAKKCPKCGLVKYPQICPAVIVAIIKDSKILLAHSRNFRSGMYGVISGFVEPGETFEECVKREAMEEVKIKVKNIKYFKSQPWPFPNSIMVAFTAEYESGELTPDGVEIEDAGWYGVDNLPTVPANYSVARQLINWYLEQYSVNL